MNILEVDSIGKILGGQRVLTAATFVVCEGEVVGLLGRMGVGKSTLLRICAGVTRPDSGWVRFDGVQYFKPRLSDLAHQGMYFLAEGGNLGKTLTLRQHFRAVREKYGSTGQDEVIHTLKLDVLFDRPTVTLSGGERRRAEIGVAVLRSPRCLLLDEPFRGLDPLVADLIGATLRRLAERGCAVLLTGHEVGTLVPFLDSVIWLTAGTTYSLGRPSEAWNNERFRAQYLGRDGIPY